MTLKSDRWIRQQCTQPLWVVKEEVMQLGWDRRYEGIEDGVGIGTVRPGVVQRERERFGWELAVDLEARRLCQEGTLARVLNYRAVTEKDLQGWRPMISPFVAGQIREIERDGTREEKIAMDRLGSSAAADVSLNKEQVGLILGWDPQTFRVDPLLGLQRRQKAISFGTSSYGYDVRLARQFKIFTNVFNGMIDPLKADEKIFVDHEGDYCVIPPNSYILGHTEETFVMPRDTTAICLGKSTYARCGAIVNVTPIEAGFRGQVVIEISNATPLPMKVHAGQGIAQFLFFQSDEQCDVSYADRAGKYQDQQGLQTALV